MNAELQLLMRYYDSEVESGERVQVAHRLLRDRAQREQLRQWEQIGSAIRELSNDSPEVDLTEGILRGVSHRESRPSPQPRARGRLRAFAALGCSAAAALLVAASWSGGPEQKVGPTDGPRNAEQNPESTLTSAQRAEPALASRSPAAIERVDFGEQTGSIFVVSVGERETPVVWLSDDEQAGRIVQL